MLAPGDQRERRDHDRRAHHRAVAEDRPAREHGDDLGDDPHRGQDQRVDLRVRGEPEEMLVEDGVAAAGRVEEVRAAVAVELEHRQHGHEHGQHEHEHPAPREHRPDVQRHAHEASSRGRAACGS